MKKKSIKSVASLADLPRNKTCPVVKFYRETLLTVVKLKFHYSNLIKVIDFCK
jgi:hypothetical protein